MVKAQAISVKDRYKSSYDQTTGIFSLKTRIRRLKSSPESYGHGSNFKVFYKFRALITQCLLLLPPRYFPYEIKMDKYRPCPSMISMFTSDSQHPPRSRHAVHLGVNDPSFIFSETRLSPDFKEKRLQILYLALLTGSRTEKNKLSHAFHHVQRKSIH